MQQIKTLSCCGKALAFVHGSHFLAVKSKILNSLTTEKWQIMSSYDLTLKYVAVK